jgi:hypothetical protein
MLAPFALLVAAAALLGALLTGLRRLLAGTRTIEGVELRTPTEDTRIEADGAVRSIQAADLIVPDAMVAELWNTEMLERLARTYWSFLSACTLGIIRVYYTDTERYVCLLVRPLKLLTFDAPEYETSQDRGIVRWRIRRGILVARRGRQEGEGYLEIDVRRARCNTPAKQRLHVEVEIANFYPAVASTLSRFVYTHTQSRIHVIVCYGFLRRLARRELDPSVIGRFRRRAPESTPEPRRERAPEPHAGGADGQP